MTTVNQTIVQEVDWANLCGTYIGLVIGVIGLPLNVLVILAIGHSKNKTRNYDLLAGLAFGDVLNASSYICYSIRSIIVMHSVPFTMPPFRCLLEGVHLTVGEMAEAACSWMIALLALDRFICMSATMTYRTLGSAYTYGMVIFTYVYAALDVIVSLIGSYNLEQESIFEPYCYHSRSVARWYYQMHVYQICICGYLSMVLYALALMCLKHKGRKIHLTENSNDSVMKINMKREIMVTKRIAVIILTTFLLQSLPMTINMTSLGNTVLFDNINIFVFLLYEATSTINVLVYFLSITDFRHDFLSYCRALLHLKE